MRFRTLIMCGAGALSVGLLIGLSADEILVTKRLTILNDTGKTAIVAMADAQGRGLLIVYDEAGEELFAVRKGAVTFSELRRLDAEITLHASQVRRLQKRVEALEKKDSSAASTEVQEAKPKPKPVHWKRSPGPAGSGSDKEAGQVESTKKWYEGGTLHDKSAIEWQTASSADKLATCTDFIAATWRNGNLKPSIAKKLSTLDDVRPYAEELVECLDAAFKPDPDPERNRMLFGNQTVSGCAAACMVIMGWTE